MKMMILHFRSKSPVLQKWYCFYAHGSWKHEWQRGRISTGEICFKFAAKYNGAVDGLLSFYWRIFEKVSELKEQLGDKEYHQ